MTGIEMHSSVALLEDLPEHGLVRGHVGTVVETWAPKVYEVEFANADGEPYAMVAVKGPQLLVLHFERVPEVA